MPIGADRRLRELAQVFLKLGTTAFGGPAAHVAMMEEEVVVRRQWLSREEFLDYLGATNLIPGPNSTELAIHVGQARAGWPGLLVAGACFILPAALIVAGLGWAYVRYGSLPAVEGLLYGIKPVVIAIVAQALIRLAHAAAKTWPLGLLGVMAAAAVVLGVDELLVLALAAALASVLLVPPRAGQGRVMAVVPGLAALTTPATFGLWPLFLIFLKIGSVLFGSGYVLLAFLRADLVERLGWLTERQLLDAIAVGQMTPGPVFTTATFAGYLLGGGIGAVVATLGIFLPAFFFVALSTRILPRLKASPVARAALDGINVASLALMAVVTWQLASASLIDGPTLLLAILGLVVLLRSRVNSSWLVASGGALGLLLHRG